MAHSVTNLFVKARESEEIQQKEVAPLKKSLGQREAKLKDMEAGRPTNLSRSFCHTKSGQRGAMTLVGFPLVNKMFPSLRLGPSEFGRSYRGYFDGRSFWLDRYVHLRGVGRRHWLERVSRREESGGVLPPWKRRARRIHRSGGRREGGALLNDIDRLRWWWPDHVNCRAPWANSSGSGGRDCLPEPPDH
nr:hypothetical protein Iba_chr13fCG8760 [Ipomoea batatas]